MACLFSIFRRKRNQRQHAQDQRDVPGIEAVKIYSYKQLSRATGGFSLATKIGEGGFGSVYRGTLKDGNTVAIKVLSSESRQGVKEFLTELSVISSIAHENLVRLHGCCAEGHHRILVYNYLVNNSLAQTLLADGHSSIQFSWKLRTQICVGIAQGLAFLHEELQPHILHRDIKASNILLDKDLTPKISDFGLARLLPANATHVSTKVAGTLGYLAPEYALQGKVTRKTDIYSFGILLLEIVTGRCSTNMRLPQEDRFLLERIWKLYECGQLATIIDATLNDCDTEEACKFLKIGLLCTQDNPNRRPNMSSIIKLLTGGKLSQEILKPGLISDLMDFSGPMRSNEQTRTSATSPSSLGSTMYTSTTEFYSHS